MESPTRRELRVIGFVLLFVAVLNMLLFHDDIPVEMFITIFGVQIIFGLRLLLRGD